MKLPKNFYILYFGQPLLLEMPKDEGNELDIGHVLLTKVGQELAPICGSKPIDGFVEFVKEEWKAHIPAPVTERGASGAAPQAARP
jgi:hypothetical protein